MNIRTTRILLGLLAALVAACASDHMPPARAPDAPAPTAEAARGADTGTEKHGGASTQTAARAPEGTGTETATSTEAVPVAPMRWDWFRERRPQP
jgi:hypothetical protein